MVTMTEEAPHVWVGCLGCYNAGGLVGRWVDAIDAGDVTVESLHDDATTQLGSPVGELDPYYRSHEELWCFDHEGFGGLLSGECSPAEAQRIAEAIGELDEWQPVEAVAAFLGNYGGSITDDGALADFEESYAGEYRDGAEYAEQLADEIGAVDADAGWPTACIDWERAWRELTVGGDYWEADAPGGVYIFRAV